MRGATAFLLGLLASGLIVTDASAHGVRVVVHPWWPPIVIGPPPVRRLPPPVVPIAVPVAVPVATPVPVEPAPEAATQGWISFETQPYDCLILLNSQDMGRADKVKTLALEPGAYDVSVRKDGFKPADFQVTVKAGKTIALDVTLQPVPAGAGTPVVPDAVYKVDLDKTGSLTLDITPPDASVYIDDKSYGIAATFPQDESSIVLQAGPHKVQVLRPGFKPYVSTVDVQADGEQKLTIVLEKE